MTWKLESGYYSFGDFDCQEDNLLFISLLTSTTKCGTEKTNQSVIIVFITLQRERIMFITHLKPLQPKTAITDDLYTSKPDKSSKMAHFVFKWNKEDYLSKPECAIPHDNL